MNQKPSISGPGICDSCGDTVKELMIINQEGGPEVTAVANLCFCRNCAGGSWPKQILVIGDIHADWQSCLYKVKNLDIRNAVLISVGDIGIGFIPPDKQGRQIEHLNDFFTARNVEFIGIRGNHDDPQYFDGSVNLSHFRLLKDYHTEVINDKKFLFVGGAISIDRKVRRWGVNYWSDEKFVLKPDLVEKCDVLITHTAPIWNGPFDKTNISDWVEKDLALWPECYEERRGVGELIKLAKPKKHYCGHFHLSSWNDVDECESRILDILEICEIR